MSDQAEIQTRYGALLPLLDERARRLVVAAESQTAGRGGISAVSRATGVSRQVIRRGVAELKQPASLPANRIRREGGGRKKAVDIDTSFKSDLEKLLESTTSGDPDAPLRWTCKSIRHLTAELNRMNHVVSHQVVSDLLHELGYSLQANSKTTEGTSHSDRGAQFEHLNGKVKWFLGRKQPVIFVEMKNKELVCDPRNDGPELGPRVDLDQVKGPVLADRDLGGMKSFGVSDVGRNSEWVSVGMDRETAEFAVENVRRWWRIMGREAHPQATQLLIAADSRGDNPARLQLWKAELQKLADETQLQIWVCHFPPASSKWNMIEHQLVSFISQNWRGKPATGLQVTVSSIGEKTPSVGLRVSSECEGSSRKPGIKVCDHDETNFRRGKSRDDWNYEIQPRKPLS
jgi:transposase